MSLPDDIPVPRRAAGGGLPDFGAPAASEVGLTISVGLGVGVGSRKAEHGPLILPGQEQT